MSLRWAMALLVLAAACKSNGTRTTDTRSTNIKSKELKLAFLKDYMSGPTVPLDAEFHILFHDNSGSLLSGGSDYDFQAVIRVTPDQTFKWADGCTRYRLEAFPPWAEPLLRGKDGWEINSQPDTFRCGQEERVIHVKEGVIFRRLRSEG